MLLTKQCCFFSIDSKHCHSQIQWGCCNKLFKLPACEQRGFPEMTTAGLNEAHRRTAYLGLFLESVNNGCLTRKRIPSVTLSNRGLALFLKHKKGKHNKNTKTSRDKTDPTKTFQSKWKVSVRRWDFLCVALSGGRGGNVLQNITVKYSVVPTT